MTARTVLVVALALALLPMPVESQASAAVRFTAPAEGATFASGTVVLRLDVSGLDLVDPALAAGRTEGQGHLEIRVDGKPVRGVVEDGDRTAATTVVVAGLRPGRHTATAELVDGDGEEWGPSATVNFTVAPDAPMLRFREGKPWPGQRGESLRAEVSVERAPGAGLLGPTVRWSLDGQPVAEGEATWHTYANLTGAHRIRADLLGPTGERLDPAVWDEMWVNVPEVELADPPTGLTAGEGFAPADVPLQAELDGFDPARHALRVHVDGAVAVERADPADVRVPLAVGRHVVAVEMTALDGRSLGPVVADAVVVQIAPPPPEARFRSPRNLETVTPGFLAHVDVANFTLGDDADAPASSRGHLHWYLDGEKVDEGTTPSRRFEDLASGMRELEVRLATPDHQEVGGGQKIRVNVEPPPQEAGGSAETKDAPGAGAALAAVAALGAALARRR